MADIDFNELWEWFDAQPKPYHTCKVCGKDYLVFADIPEGGYIVCCNEDQKGF